MTQIMLSLELLQRTLAATASQRWSMIVQKQQQIPFYIAAIVPETPYIINGNGIARSH